MATADNMSKSIVKPTMCPACGKLFDYNMYPMIHIPGDNKLRKKILNKTLFFPKCPFCGEEFKLKANCFYRDDIRQELIVVLEKPDKKLERMLMQDNLPLNDLGIDERMADFIKAIFKRRIVYNVDSFREKILVFDSNYDDRIIELMKYSLSHLLEKDNHMPVYRIFLEESSGNQLLFVAIMGSKPPFEYVTAKTPSSAYSHYRDKYLNKLAKPEDDEYIFCDQKWASESGLLEGEDEGFVIPL